MTNVVEEEEYIMDMDDDEEDDYQPSEPSEFTPADTLDGLVVQISDYAVSKNINPVQLRQRLFEEQLRPLASNHGYENLILSSAPEDEGYNALLTALYPALAPHLSRAINQQNRPTLIDLLGRALAKLMESEEVVAPVEVTVDYDEDEDEFADELDPEIEANTARVMMVYKDLFEVGFELQVPYGVLTKEGSLRLGKNKTVNTPSSSLAVMYEIINEITGGFLVQSTTESGAEASGLRDIELRTGTTYYPEFQLGNLRGVLGDKRVDSWDELSRHIEPEIRENIKKNLEEGRNIEHIVDALTTAMVISEFDPKSALRLRVNVGNAKINLKAFQREYENRKTSFMSGIGSLYHTEMTSTGVLEVIIVFNQAAFNGKPLFAYEAVDNLLKRGRRPSLSNMILGQDTSGKILTENLNTQQACIILVGAGQRSGKGVLTLNLLGTVLSEGSPLIYLDGKPDMAPVLWDMGKRHNVKPAAWDLFEHNGNPIGSGAPARMLEENPGIFGLLMYLKALQIMMVAASLQSKGVDFLDGKRPFFIFDEAYAVQMTMASTWQKVLDTAKDKQADPEERDWCLAIVKWAEGLDADLPAVINSQLPKSGISTVWLFQSMQPTSWNQYAVGGMGSNKLNIMKKPIESRLSIKFLGRGTADSEYALGSAKVKESKLISNRVLSEGGRHFAKTGNQKITDMDSVTVFKPYLVLNEAETGSKSAEELKSNLSSDVMKIVAPNGDLDARAGFEGFAQMLGDDAIQNLSKGREYLEAVLTQIGVMQNYSSVDEYLYDSSAESFRTLGSLVKGAEEPVSEASSVNGFYDTDILNDTSTFTPSAGVVEDADLYNAEEEGFDYMPDETPLADDGFPDTDYSEPELPVDETEPVIPEPLPSRVGRNNSASVEPPVETAPTASPNSQMHYDNVYNPKVELPQNPFKTFGASENPMSALNAIKFTSNFLMQEIQKLVGDFNRVHSFEVTGTGLVINNIAFRPQFSKEVIDSMPFDIRNQAVRGNMVELFHFGNLAKFRNLEVLRIDNGRLAEGRVRREIGLSPKKTWFKLFSRFRNLQELYINGALIQDEDTAQGYDDDGRGGYTLTEKLREKLQMPVSAVSNSRMERVWNSTPVKVMGGAVGMTLGVKAVAVAASLFGGWGLLFGAFAGAAAIKEYRKRN